MKKLILKDLKVIEDNYGKYSSFLLYGNKNDFPYEKIEDFIDKVNLKYMFIALNPSSKKIEKKFGNFHYGRFDGRLKALSKDKNIKGCYITDLIKVDKNNKSFNDSKGKQVCKQVKKDEDLFNLNIQTIKKEYELLHNPKIVLIGSGVQEIFSHYENNEIVKYIKKNGYIKIPHYSYQYNCLCCDKEHECIECYIEKVYKELKKGE